MSRFKAIATIAPGNSIAVLGLLTDLAGAAATQSSLSSLTRTIYNAAGAGTAADWVVVSETALTISAVMFNTLQTGNGWQAAWGEGYNLRDIITGVGNTDESAAQLVIVYTAVDASGRQWKTKGIQVATEDQPAT